MKRNEPEIIRKELTAGKYEILDKIIKTIMQFYNKYGTTFTPTTELSPCGTVEFESSNGVHCWLAQNRGVATEGPG